MVDKVDKEEIAKEFIRKIDNQSEIDLGYNDKIWLTRNLFELLDEKEAAQSELPIKVEARNSVCRFANAMEKVLKANDHKGGWEDSSYRYLEARLVEEMGEYFHDVAADDRNSEAQKELLDIANYCMMLWDNLGGD